jgi:hypothetical protein
MSCVILLQSTASTVSVYVELSAGGPALLLADTDVTVEIQKFGGSYAAMNPVLDATSWTDTLLGTYTIDLSADDTGTLGNMYVRVSGATIKTALFPFLISEAAPAPTATLPVTTTLLFGYVLDAQGGPLAGASVSAKVLATPSVGYSVTEGYVQGQTLVTADTDASGFFQISLVTGSQVDLFIPSANYRRTLEVPVTSTNVFDIP